MSVPENERTECKLEACVKALDLAAYTLQITKNKKIFVEEYQNALTDEIIATAIDIYTSIRSANDSFLEKINSSDILTLQINAIAKCNKLLGLIDIAKPLFHLESRRVYYWGNKIITVRELINKQYKVSQKHLTSI